MKNKPLDPPVGGETLGTFGPLSLQGSTISRSLSWRGYQPLHVTEIQEVKNLFDHGIISALIILDSVPVQVSHDLCRFLRSTNSRTPIVVLLDSSKRDEALGLLDSGADHYAITPVQIDTVLHQIRTLTRRPRLASYRSFPASYAK